MSVALPWEDQSQDAKSLSSCILAFVYETGRGVKEV